jgi:uncharacterized protein YbjT (DUF2867 family)
MTERTILVTGAAGFLGGHMLAALRSRAGRVVGRVRRDAQAAKVTMLAGMAWLLPIAVVPGSGQERFEPISAIDVAAAAIKVLDISGTVGQRYQIAGPEIMTLDHVCGLVLRTVRIKRPKLHGPMTLLRPLIQLFDKFLPEPPVTPGLLDLLALDILAQVNAAGMLLGRQPLKFGENMAYATEVKAGGFLAITFGRRDRRGEGVVDAGP